ncbi:MAG: biopolymer transporter ExbD [Betaproteobacteria bacterium]|jgi:biopolymer transport protein ExbD|nr:MAG: biopolymer transporter ExbD [Betaproteobacteria bacterium]
MRFRRAFIEEPELNLIPLIDVLLVVLIFLAVSTTYSRFTQLQIELPSADADRPQTRLQEIQVAVTADGRFAIDKAVVPMTDPESLSALLRAAAQNNAAPLIVINADAQAPHQAVVTVMEAARLAGVTHLSFATQRRSSGR